MAARDSHTSPRARGCALLATARCRCDTNGLPRTSRDVNEGGHPRTTLAAALSSNWLNGIRRLWSRGHTSATAHDTPRSWHAERSKCRIPANGEASGVRSMHPPGCVPRGLDDKSSVASAVSWGNRFLRWAILLPWSRNARKPLGSANPGRSTTWSSDWRPRSNALHS